MAEKDPFSGPIRRTELPIYIEDVDKYRQAVSPKVENTREQFVVTRVLNESFDSVGQQITDIYGKYHDDYKNLQDKFNTGVAHASVTLDYLRQEENDLPRAGAVAMAGMTGLILGLRGGFFRRLLYTSVTASGMAALCYPKQAMEISKDLMVNSKKYAAIGYNFVYGVKPEGDAPVSKSSAPPKEISSKVPASANKVKGDIGQSNPEDKDLYTTRT